jgi:hypothetical protein
VIEKIRSPLLPRAAAERGRIEASAAAARLHRRFVLVSVITGSVSVSLGRRVQATVCGGTVGPPRAFHISHVLFDPDPHTADCLSQTLAERRELVVYARRNLGMDATCHETVTFKLSQGLRQHLLTDAADSLAESRAADLTTAVEASMTSRVHLSAMRSRISRTSASLVDATTGGFGARTCMVSRREV